MDENILIKRSSWELSLKEFKEKILKEIHLNPSIPPEIRNEVEVIDDLLLHSYYNSEFIDIAYTTAIITLEKLLRIRSKELGNKMEEKPLFELFKWFFNNNYFETTEMPELDHLRKTRNKKFHLADIFKGFLNFLINIYSIFDLMSDLYEDVELRLKRRELKLKLNEQLNIICKNGFIVEINNKLFLGHFASILFLNNKVKLPIMHLRVGRCVISEVAELGADRDNFDLIEWDINETQLTGKLSNGNSFKIRPLSDPIHFDQFAKWRENYPLWSLDLFDGLERVNYQEKLRLFYRNQDNTTDI